MEELFVMIWYDIIKCKYEGIYNIEFIILIGVLENFIIMIVLIGKVLVTCLQNDKEA